MTDRLPRATFIFALAITFIALLIGTAVVSPCAAYATGNDKQSMYRLYNPNSGEHFYTASTSERDNLERVGWSYEGVGWVAPTKSSTPVYRLYSGTDHHYTISTSECDYLKKAGWKYEGIGWYSDDNKSVALHRQFNPNVNPKAKYNNSGSHNYTISTSERDNLVKFGWRDEGVGWYGCTHTHSRTPVYKTVHHDAVYYTYSVCKACGQESPSMEHLKQHALNGEVSGTNSATRIQTPAYDEQVVDHYKCSICGAEPV